MPTLAIFGTFFAIFKLLTGSTTLQKHFYLIEEVLSFDLVGHMWKSLKNWLQEWVFNIYKWKWGRSRWTEYFKNYLQKWFVENLAGKSCGKILWENLVGKSCRKFLWEILVGKSCGKSCGKILSKSGKKSQCWQFLAHFLPFLGLLQAIKHHQTIFSCRGGSKLWFGGSYVKISQELTSEMHFLYR